MTDIASKDKPYRTWVVEFRQRWLVEAQTPEAAKAWADWTLSGLQASMPRVDPHPLGVIVLGPAGGPHTSVIALIPMSDDGQEDPEP